MKKVNRTKFRYSFCIRLMTWINLLVLFLSIVASRMAGKFYWGFYLGLFIGNLCWTLFLEVFKGKIVDAERTLLFQVKSVAVFCAYMVFAYLLYIGSVSLLQVVLGLVLSKVTMWMSIGYNFLVLNKEKERS